MATKTWTGTTNSNWDVDANWGGTKPSAGDDLIFPAGPSNKTLTNNMTADMSFASITVQDTGYTLNGNRITLAGNITSNSDVTINLAIILAVNVTINKGSATVTMGGIISGAAYDLSLAGSGSVVLQGVNTFGNSTHGLKVLAGTAVSSDNVTAFGAGNIYLGNGVADGTPARLLAYNNGTIANPIILVATTTGTLTMTGFTNRAPTFSGGVTGANNLTINNTHTSGGTITFATGSINNTGTVTNVGTGSNAQVTISSVIGTNVTGVIQNSATSPLTLSGVNTYTGYITNSAGTLNITQSGTYSTLTLAAGTTTTITSGKTLTLTNLVSNGTSGSHATLNSSTGGSYHTLTKSGAGTITASNMSIQDSHAGPANTWYAQNSTNVSGNTGWVFGNLLLMRRRRMAA